MGRRSVVDVRQAWLALVNLTGQPAVMSAQESRPVGIDAVRWDGRDSAGGCELWPACLIFLGSYASSDWCFRLPTSLPRYLDILMDQTMPAQCRAPEPCPGLPDASGSRTVAGIHQQKTGPAAFIVT